MVSVANGTCACVCVLCSIGGATGYRVSEVTGLMEGSTLIVGGKEVEVCGYTQCGDITITCTTLIYT